MTRRSVMLMILLTTPFLVSISAAQKTPFQYAVKFVCGKSDGRMVAPGQYFTVVNVHNPGPEGIRFFKKFAIAMPEQKAGPVSRVYDAELKSDEAFSIECNEIREKAHAPSFAEGFIVFETKFELDVVAVYTTAGSTRTVQTMELERVPVRRTP